MKYRAEAIDDRCIEVGPRVVVRADSVGVATVGPYGRAEAGDRYCVAVGPNSHVRFGVVRP